MFGGVEWGESEANLDPQQGGFDGMSVRLAAPASGIPAIPDPAVDVWKVIVRAFG